MRIFLRVVLFVIGFLLFAVGGVAAWVVGPDDTVDVGTVDHPGGAIYTAPELFTYENVTITVTGEADSGEVFVAAAHPVDVSDVVADGDAFRISAVTFNSLVGAADNGRPIPDPRAIDVFDSVSGAGPQTLAYPIDGVAPQFLFYAPDGAGVTASIGFTVDGAFLVCLAVAGGGLLIVLGGWFLTRPRPRRDSGESTASNAWGSADTSVPGRDQEAAPSAVSRRVAAVLGTGALLLPLSACAMIPEPITTVETTKVALTPDQVGALWEDYDRRNNAAIKAAAAPGYDASLWKKADSGVLLKSDLYRTTLAKALSKTDDPPKGKKKPSLRTTSGDWVSSRAFDSYPLWALVHEEHVDPSAKKKGKDEKKNSGSERDEAVGVALVVRESAVEPWKLHNGLRVPEKNLPEFPVLAEDPTEDQVAAVNEASEAVSKYVTTGKDSDIFGEIREHEALRTDFEKAVDESENVTLRLTAGTVDEDDVHIVRGGDATYAMINQTYTFTREPKSDWDVWWDEGYDAVNGDSGDSLYSREAVTLLIAIDDDGVVDVLAVTSRGIPA